jgi:CRISPR-associated protein Csx17
MVLTNGVALANELIRPATQDRALRIALALATGRDRVGGSVPTLGGLRPLLAPVRAIGGRVGWTDTPARCPLSGGLIRALADAARRRAFPGAVEHFPNRTQDIVPAVQGSRIAFALGWVLRASDIRDLVRDPTDDHRTADLLAGLLTIDWQGLPEHELPSGPAMDVAVDPLLPFAATTPLAIRADNGTMWPLLVRPGSEWPTQLAADHVQDVLVDAARRLRIGGLRFVVTPHPARMDGVRLAAVLLLRATRSDMIAALHRVAVLPDFHRIEEIPA